MRSFVIAAILLLVAGCQGWDRVRRNAVWLVDEEEKTRAESYNADEATEYNAALLQKNEIAPTATIPVRSDSGVLTNVPLSGNNTEKSVAASDSAAEPNRENVELDFQDISLRELLRLFFEEYLHKPYTILDDFKDKKVNFVFQGSISKTELLGIFETFLGFHGVKLKFNQGVYAITSGTNKIKSLPSVNSIGDTIGIFRCQYIDVKDFQAAGRLFVSDPSSTVLLSMSNSLLIKAPSAQIKALKSLQKSIDIPFFQGKYLLIYAPKVLSMSSTKALLSKFEHSLGGKLGHPNRGIEVEEILGANKLVIVLSSRKMRDEVLAFLAVTDNAEGNRRQLFTYSLSNQKATEILTTVKGLLRGVLGDAEKDANVVADKQSNSLFFMATAEEYAEILKIMQKLDHRTPAIHVEVLIAEAILNDSMVFGVEWFLEQTSSDSITDLGVNLTDAALLASGAGATFGVASLVDNQFFAVQALALETDLTVLSNPHIIVKSGFTAHINVGQNISVPKSETTTDTSGSSSQIDFDRHDVTVNLEVTPTISPDGTIQLRVKLNDEGFVGRDVDSQPIFSKRELSTDMVLHDNQTVLLGGMMKRRTEMIIKKIPLFGDIPYLGYFFRAEDEKEELTELFMMITPRLIMDKQGASLVTSAVLEAARLTKQNYNELNLFKEWFQ